MSIDIIIYALVAAVLLFRLWSVFGQRSDDEVNRPNPFVVPPPQEIKADTKFQDKIQAQETTPTLKLTTTAPASLAGSLEQIRVLDTGFDEKKFLQGARQAFAVIIENFSHDNLSYVQRLLGPNVLPHFQDAIVARQKAGQKLQNKIVSIVDAEVAAARTEGTKLFIVVRFVSHQENTLYDQSGQVIGGHVGKVEEVTDLWEFGRDSQSPDPNWILVETRG